MSFRYGRNPTAAGPALTLKRPFGDLLPSEAGARLAVKSRGQKAGVRSETLSAGPVCRHLVDNGGKCSSTHPADQPLPCAVLFSGHGEYSGAPLRDWLDELVLAKGTSAPCAEIADLTHALGIGGARHARLGVVAAG